MTRTKPLSDVKPLFVYVLVNTTTGLPNAMMFWSRSAATHYKKLYTPDLASQFRVRRAKMFVYNK